MSACIQKMNTSEPYNAKHCVEVMKLLNADRIAKTTSCDGILQAKGREYPVHKPVVAVVSEYLKNLFSTEMREKNQKVLKISDMTDVVLGNILDFIYTGFVKMTSENVLDLLEGAEYMQVDGLKSNCKDYLVQSTSVENCLKLRAYGQRYNLDEVCDASDRVIAENFSDVVQHKDFNELDSDAIFAVINARKETTYEEVVFTSIVRWVNHNIDQRQELFVKLYSLVDLSALCETFMSKNVLSEPLVFDSLPCLQRLNNPSGPLKLIAKSSGKAEAPEMNNADKFIVIGGQGSEIECVTYDWKGKHPQQFPKLNKRRCGATVVKIKYNLHIAGGSVTPYSSSDHQSTEMLNLQYPMRWVKIADMLEGRRHAESAVSNGRMVVTGGNNGNSYLRSCEIYNCELNQWIQMKPMLQARAFHAMVSLNGLNYCIGGFAPRNLSSAEYYDEKIDEWKEIAPMPTARSGLAAVALNGFIYAIGGLSLTTVERYNPKTNTWTKRGDLNVGRNRPGACVMKKKIYVIGGGSHGVPTKSVEVYDEAEDKWEICYDMDVHACYSAVIAV